MSLRTSLSLDALHHKVSHDGGKVNDLSVTSGGETKQSESLHSETEGEVKKLLNTLDFSGANWRPCWRLSVAKVARLSSPRGKNVNQQETSHINTSKPQFCVAFFFFFLRMLPKPPPYERPERGWREWGGTGVRKLHTVDKSLPDNVAALGMLTIVIEPQVEKEGRFP